MDGKIKISEEEFDEAVAKAISVAKIVDQLESTMTDEEVRARRRKAAIHGFTEGITAGHPPTEALRADVRDWIDNKLAMADLVARVAARIKEEQAREHAQEEEAA